MLFSFLNSLALQPSYIGRLCHLLSPTKFAQPPSASILFLPTPPPNFISHASFSSITTDHVSISVPLQPCHSICKKLPPLPPPPRPASTGSLSYISLGLCYYRQSQYVSPCTNLSVYVQAIVPPFASTPSCFHGFTRFPSAFRLSLPPPHCRPDQPRTQM